MSAQVLCIGSAIADITAWPVDFKRIATDHQPAEQLFLGSGGCAGNVSIGLAHLGKHVQLLARLGDDAMGDLVRGHLRRQGVDLERLVMDQTGQTGRTLVLIDDCGERRFVYSPGVNANLDVSDLQGVLPTEAALVHVSDFFLLPKLLHQPIAQFLAQVQAAGVITSVDTIYDPSGVWWANLEPCLPHLDFLFVSEEEARHLLPGLKPAEVLQTLIDRGCGQVILKRGELGCMLHDGKEVHQCPAPKLQPLDTTGAGDAFVAAFLAAHLEGIGSVDCLEIATAFAVENLGQIGATAGMKSYPSARAILEQRQD